MNGGTSFGYPMTSDSNGYYCSTIYSRPTLYYNSSTGLYEDFLDSLSDTSYNKHTAAEIRFAKKFFSNYLSEDELVTKQKTGRFWEVSNCGCPTIKILLDDDTALTVWCDNGYEEKIEERDTAVLPENIRYKKYKGDEQ
jgi:hypothetical protein